MEPKINELEITKLRLEPDDVLVVRVHGNCITKNNLHQVQKQFAALLKTNNIVAVSEAISLCVIQKPISIKPEHIGV